MNGVVAFNVLTNDSLTTLILSYQYGVTHDLSRVCRRQRRSLKLSPFAQQKALILSQPDIFRCYMLLKLIEKNDLHHAKELLRQRPNGYLAPPVEASYIYGINNAAHLRDIEIIKFLHENQLAKATKDAMDIAASNGDIEIVQYLHANRKEGCSLIGFILAERYNYTAVIEYLNEHCSRDRNASPSVDPKLLAMNAVAKNMCHIQ
ncbi:hypothetical protein THRCLA_06849 [Thraustotheca clavata]|uniref:Uncharacterized protein n=1 Tax=Thraustotheca clavata TaxID=74557 RepID=A0A1V9ZIK7_9STRA|nr:hypothetical protein THRCLA_06849 [Thraustotheca clavata]